MLLHFALNIAKLSGNCLEKHSRIQLVPLNIAYCYSVLGITLVTTTIVALLPVVVTQQTCTFKMERAASKVTNQANFNKRNVAM